MLEMTQNKYWKVTRTMDHKFPIMPWMFWMRVSKQVHLHSCLYKTNKKKHRTLTAYNKLLELQPIWQLQILTNSLLFCLKTNRIMFSSLWPLALTFCPKKTPPSRFHWDEKSSVGSHCSLPPTGTEDGPSGQLFQQSTSTQTRRRRAA